MRPQYETDAQRKAEDDLARFLEAAWNCKISDRLGDYAYFDRLGFRAGDPRMWLELKCRDNASDKYPDYMISMRKVTTAIRWLRLTTLETIFVVRFTDKTIWFNPLTSPYDEREGGRHDRGDPDDVERCAFFKPEVFKLVVRANRI